MRNIPARRIAALVVVVGLLALVTYQVGVWLASKGIDQADKVSSVASAVIAVLGLLFPFLRQVLGWARGRMPITDIDIARARDTLATVLDEQCANEDGLHQVYNPRPLPVRWEVTNIARAAMPGISRQVTGEDVPAHGGGFDDVLAMFSGLARHRVVVLGLAGAGKSVLIMKLARELLAARQPGNPVPVIVPAGAWNPSISLPEWVTAHLISRYPILAMRHRSATGEIGTLAHLLVSGGGVLPVLDGLDELPKSLRSAAIEQINEYGSDRPLVVTSRSPEYNEASQAHRAVACALVVELRPLRVLEVKEYLLEATAATPDGRWDAVLARLDAEPDGPLTKALTTPLLLWLARTIYHDSDTNPAELADVTRFADRETIEHHLLDTLVPAVYAPRANHRRRGRPRYTSRQAQRWLAFLAAHLNRTGEQDIAWWRLTAALRGTGGFGVVLRLWLLGGLLWALLSWLMERHGNWRNDAYVDSTPFRDLLFGGVIGRRIRPTVDPLLDALPPEIRDKPDAFLRIAATVEFNVITIAAVFIVILLVWWSDRSGITPSPKALRFIPLHMLVKTVLVEIFSIAFLFSLLLLFLSFLPRKFDMGTFITDELLTSTNSQLILLVVLLCLSSVTASLAAPIDVSREVDPDKILRLDRRADLVVIIIKRVIFGALMALLVVPDVVFAYAVFAVGATLVRILAGGDGSSWQAYTQARQWLFLGRRLPWRTMAFLSDAHQRGVLRRVGTVYQFRHIRLQERLAARYPRWRPYFELIIELIERWSVAVRNVVRMRLYTWRVTRYPAIHEMLDLVRRRAPQLMGEHLVGVYLHGSLTTGDFDQHRSDVDLLVVGQSEPDHTTHDALQRMRAELRQIQASWTDRINMEYTSARALGATAGSVPVTPSRPLSADTAPLLLRYALRKRGISIIGPSPRTLTPYIPHQVYAETFRAYLDELATQAWDDTTNDERLRAVHIVCRGIYACHYNVMGSREDTVFFMYRELPDPALPGRSWLVHDTTGWRAKAPDVAGLARFFAAAAGHPALAVQNEPRSSATATSRPDAVETASD